MEAVVAAAEVAAEGVPPRHELSRELRPLAVAAEEVVEEAEAEAMEEGPRPLQWPQRS